MTARLNHTIVAARDQDRSATFLAEMLGLPAPLKLGHFTVVTVGDRLTLDFTETENEIVPQHYAFLVEEAEFDEIFARIAKRGIPMCARRNERGRIARARRASGLQRYTQARAQLTRKEVRL